MESYRSIAAMPNDMWMTHFKEQARDASAKIHRISGNDTPAGIYGVNGMIVLKGHEKSNETTTPLEVVEPTERVAAQAKSDLMNGINSDGSSSICQYVGKPPRGSIKKVQPKKVAAKVKRIRDVFSDSRSVGHIGKKKKK